MTEKQSDVLIVGAGLAGLAAGRLLHAAGVDVQVVDKGRRVGGRMATLRLGQAAADHGVQFFTVDSPEFRQEVDGWEAAGLAFLWDIGWSLGSFAGNEGEGHTRYAVRGGMDRLMEYLAEDLTGDSAVDTDTRLVAVRQTEGGWQAEAENGDSYRACGLILTPPPPQSLALLDAGAVGLSAMDRGILEALDYSSTLTGIFRIEGGTTIPAPGAVHRPAESLPWIADNRQKGVTEGGPENETIVTINSNATYAQRYWDAPQVEIVETMKAVLLPYLTPGSRVVESQVKHWRYAFPRHTHSQRTLRTSGTHPLYFAGDAFHGPLVEGAWLSGQAAAQALLGDADFVPGKYS